MATISSCLIVKNEKDKIRNCLNSILLFSDEIIIYDTGSDDGTQDICREYDKVKLIQGEWHDDFAWARTQSFKYATCDYIFWTDADDTIEEQCQRWMFFFKTDKILNGKSLEDFDVVSIPYFYAKNKSSLIPRTALIKRELKHEWKYKIHEQLIFDYNKVAFGKVTSDLFFVQHNVDKDHNLKSILRNIRIYENMEASYEEFDGHDSYQYARELLYLKKYGKAKEIYELALTKIQKPLNKLIICKEMGFIKIVEGNIKEALEYYYRAASVFDRPRADICCDIANVYKHSNNLEMAIWWYKLAVNNIPDEFDSFMCERDHYTIMPCLNVCELAYKLGRYEESKMYNEMVLKFDPTNEIAISNKEQFFS